MTGRVKKEKTTRCDLDKLEGVWSSSQLLLCGRESRLPSWASPPGASPPSSDSLGGFSLSELTPVCHSYWEVQFDTGSWNPERSL